MVWKTHGPHGGGSQHLVAKARKTYRAVAPCLLGLEPGPSAANATFSAAIGLGKWKFPADAEEHYQTSWPGPSPTGEKPLPLCMYVCIYVYVYVFNYTGWNHFVLCILYTVLHSRNVMNWFCILTMCSYSFISIFI